MDFPFPAWVDLLEMKLKLSFYVLVTYAFETFLMTIPVLLLPPDFVQALPCYEKAAFVSKGRYNCWMIGVS